MADCSGLMAFGEPTKSVRRQVHDRGIGFGALHLVGSPVGDSGDLSPFPDQWIGSSPCPDLGLVGAKPVDASLAVCPSRHGGDRGVEPSSFRGVRPGNLCL